MCVVCVCGTTGKSKRVDELCLELPALNPGPRQEHSKAVYLHMASCI